MIPLVVFVLLIGTFVISFAIFIRDPWEDGIGAGLRSFLVTVVVFLFIMMGVMIFSSDDSNEIQTSSSNTAVADTLSDSTNVSTLNDSNQGLYEKDDNLYKSDSTLYNKTKSIVVIIQLSVTNTIFVSQRRSVIG